VRAFNFVKLFCFLPLNTFAGSIVKEIHILYREITHRNERRATGSKIIRTKLSLDFFSSRCQFTKCHKITTSCVSLRRSQSSCHSYHKDHYELLFEVFCFSLNQLNDCRVGMGDLPQISSAK
jgi:hypothetical protein